VDEHKKLYIDFVIKNELSDVVSFSVITVYASSPLISVDANTEFHYRINGTSIPKDYTGYPSQIISKVIVQDSNKVVLYDLHGDSMNKYIKGIFYENKEIPSYHWRLIVDSNVPIIL
jgi:hypothetical protein